MSYDIRWCVETVRENNDGKRFVVVHTPEYDSPTYNYRKMFVACMGWDYKQGEYYPMAEVPPEVESRYADLIERCELIERMEREYQELLGRQRERRAS